MPSLLDLLNMARFGTAAPWDIRSGPRGAPNAPSGGAPATGAMDPQAAMAGLAGLRGGGGGSGPDGGGNNSSPFGVSGPATTEAEAAQRRQYGQNYMDAMRALQDKSQFPINTDWAQMPGGDMYRMQGGQLISQNQLNYDTHGYGGSDPEGAGVPMRGFVGAPSFGSGMVLWPASLGGGQAGGSVGYPGQVGPKAFVQGTT